MNKLTKPLNQKEVTELAILLAANGSEMNIEELDGYLTAILCSPEPLPLDACFTDIFDGSQLSVSTSSTVPRMLTLIERHWNDIAKRLKQAYRSDKLGFSLLLSEHSSGQNWAQSFLFATDKQEEYWQILMNDKEFNVMIEPIIYLAEKYDNQHPLSVDEHKELLSLIMDGISYIYAYFLVMAEHFD